MNRREFMQCASVLVSGISASQFGFSLSLEQRVYLANAPNYTDNPIDYFSIAQRDLVTAISDVIIPATNTAGAIEAKVPRFIELMVSDWFNEKEQKTFMQALDDIDSQTLMNYQKNYKDLHLKEKVEVLEKLEDEASDSPWYELGNVLRDFISDVPFICQIKELTVWGFFTSEVGGSQILRHNPMPMRFDGDIPLSSDDSSWSFSLLDG